MIANDKQLDPQWLNDHGGARRRSKLEVLGECIRQQLPVWRYAEQQERLGFGRVCSCDYASRGLPTSHRKGCVYA